MLSFLPILIRLFNVLLLPLCLMNKRVEVGAASLLAYGVTRGISYEYSLSIRIDRLWCNVLYEMFYVQGNMFQFTKM